MALSDLNVAIGILESDGPDPFGDAHALISSWDAAYYTLNGSGFVDSLENPAGPAHATMGGTWDTFIGITTDGDGSKWFHDPTGLMVNSSYVQLNSTIEDALEIDPAGVVEVVSMRTGAIHTKTSKEQANTGANFGYGDPAKQFWRNLGRTSGAVPHRDYEWYHQITNSIYDADTHYLGPQRGAIGDGGDLTAGDYDPATDNQTTGAWVAGTDIVICTFWTPSGWRVMVNGKFVTVYSSHHRNLDGTIADAPGEAAILAQDWSPPTIHVLAGGALGDGEFYTRLHVGVERVDYCAIFPGSFSDSYFQELSNILRTQKPS